MNKQVKGGISFDLNLEHVQAIEKLAGGKKLRLSGEVKDGKLVIDNIGLADLGFSGAVFVPVNAPFKTAQATA